MALKFTVHVVQSFINGHRKYGVFSIKHSRDTANRISPLTVVFYLCLPHVQSGFPLGLDRVGTQFILMFSSSARCPPLPEILRMWYAISFFVAQMSMNVSVATDVTRTPDAPTLSGATAVLATLDTQEMAAIAVVSEQSIKIHKEFVL